MKLVKKAALLFCAISALGLVRTADAECRLDHAEYRDAAHRGFHMKLSPPKELGVPLATAVISHDKRGRLYRFEVLQSNGYGVISFVETGKTEKDARSFDAYFFASSLTPDRGKGAPPLIFLAGLGVDDYYTSKNKIPPEQLLEDAMWILVGCHK